MKKILKVLSFIFVLIPFQSFAFDKLSCESQLYDWSIWNGFGKQNRILYSRHSSTTLSEEYSRVLVVKSQTGVTVVEIYPWDGIDLIVRDKSKKYQLQTDEQSWFEITFTDKPNRRLFCRLSF